MRESVVKLSKGSDVSQSVSQSVSQTVTPSKYKVGVVIDWSLMQSQFVLGSEDASQPGTLESSQQ